MPEPKTSLGAWKEMLETWKIQKSDPNYAFDTPVPQNLKSTAKLTFEAKSIGDLAPKGLGYYKLQDFLKHAFTKV